MDQQSNIEARLEQFAKQAAQRDRERGEHHRPLFDNHLFQNHPKLLTPCVMEARATFDTLMRGKNTNLLTPLRAEYLSEKLIAQLTAIQRELGTHQLRQSETKHNRYTQQPISELYQSLAQHQQWEMRLQHLVQEQQLKLDQSQQHNYGELQQALSTAEERLKRCQQAKRKIENQITYREQHNPLQDDD